MVLSVEQLVTGRDQLIHNLFNVEWSRNHYQTPETSEEPLHLLRKNKYTGLHRSTYIK